MGYLKKTMSCECLVLDVATQKSYRWQFYGAAFFMREVQYSTSKQQYSELVLQHLSSGNPASATELSLNEKRDYFENIPASFLGKSFIFLRAFKLTLGKSVNEQAFWYVEGKDNYYTEWLAEKIQAF